MKASACLAGASLCVIMSAWAANPGAPTNAAGEPVRNPDGTTRNYSRHELAATLQHGDVLAHAGQPRGGNRAAVA